MAPGTSGKGDTHFMSDIKLPIYTLFLFSFFLSYSATEVRLPGTNGRAVPKYFEGETSPGKSLGDVPL